MAAEGWTIVVLPPDSTVSATLGPLLMGIMIEHLFLGIVCTQATAYFRHHFRGDSLFIRTIVTSLVAFNILLGIMDFMSIYQSTILSFGDFDRFDLQLQKWNAWGEAAATASVALIAHVFYICRCWTVTRSLLNTIFLTLVALLAFASGITVSIFAHVLGRLSQTARAMIPVYIWLLSTSICDITITIVLAIYFWRNSITAQVGGTKAMFSRLRRTSIETGSLTAICALLNLMLFTLTLAGHGLLVQYSISHIYTLSVLYILLSRDGLREIISTGTDAFVLTSVLIHSMSGEDFREMQHPDYISRRRKQSL